MNNNSVCSFLTYSFITNIPNRTSIASTVVVELKQMHIYHESTILMTLLEVGSILPVLLELSSLFLDPFFPK